MSTPGYPALYQINMRRLQDLTGSAAFSSEGHDLTLPGLYLDMPPCGYHVFAVAQDR